MSFSDIFLKDYYQAAGILALSKKQVHKKKPIKTHSPIKRTGKIKETTTAKTNKQTNKKLCFAVAKVGKIGECIFQELIVNARYTAMNYLFFSYVL